eukprot:1142135-Pelagomonas_calceolata.AAC.8
MSSLIAAPQGQKYHHCRSSSWPVGTWEEVYPYTFSIELITLQNGPCGATDAEEPQHQAAMPMGLPLVDVARARTHTLPTTASLTLEHLLVVCSVKGGHACKH